MSNESIADAAVGVQGLGRLVADVSVVIRTLDEALNDEMDDRVCLALDQCLSEGQFYELHATWDNSEPQRIADDLYPKWKAITTAAPATLEACEDVLEALEDRYDGAPDSITQWMAPLIAQLRAAIPLEASK